jgi:hypothetical protein
LSKNILEKFSLSPKGKKMYDQLVEKAGKCIATLQGLGLSQMPVEKAQVQSDGRLRVWVELPRDLGLLECFIPKGDWSRK